MMDLLGFGSSDKPFGMSLGYFHTVVGLLTVGAIVLFLVYAIWVAVKIGKGEYQPYGSQNQIEDDEARETQMRIGFYASVVGLLMMMTYSNIYATIKMLA